nr:MAG TPA: HTH-type transcriptional regulator [Caudoviricetes sp.]
MATSRQFCPKCGLQSLKCTRTISIGLDGHPLEYSRVSYWTCQNKECGARYMLERPEGKLRPVRKAKLE